MTRIFQKEKDSSNSYVSLNMDFIRVGDHLIFDIFIKKMNEYIIMLEEGTILTYQLVQKIKRQALLYISKKDEYKQHLNPLSLKYHIRYNQDNYPKTLELLSVINNEIFTEYLNSEDDIFDLESIKSLVKAIIYLIKDNNKYLKNIMPLFESQTNYELSTHSLNVAIYSINLGNALHFDTHKLLHLGVASLLHDIGIKNINDDIVKKSSSLSLAELEVIHHHPEYSVDIMKHNKISNEKILDAVLHHHENCDGSGYPDGLRIEDISDFASIISIVDVFDALTNSRPHRKAYSSFDALKMMMKDKNMLHKFNHSYIQMFLHTLE